jgi:hypothetical protein
VRRPVVIILSILVMVVASAYPAAAARPAAHTRARAEINVLRFVARVWRSRLPGLVDPRTHLLVNNTEAICSGRGRRYAGKRYVRFVCVVRPHIHRSRQGLYVSYRALSHGRFRIRWLVYRR